jgi:alpha(1,3/1,4) fucosyltransferase
MRILRICFVDFWDNFLETENIFTPILSKHFNVIIDENNPDIVFHSIFNGQKNIQNYKCKKILFLGENYRPSQFKSDYSISFDPESNLNYHLPLWQYYLILNPNLKERLFNRKLRDTLNYDRFCSFTVSNSSNFSRNSFYNQLSQYKEIHSYGRFLTNNFELQNISKGKYWREAKDEFFTKIKHKFSIAFENNSYPGYCTEKLMDAFLGNSLPLYWGCPKIYKDFNENAFINVMTLGNQKSIELIKELDNNDKLYLEYKNQDIFTEEQKERHLKNIENFETWLIQKIKL